jgi:REP element-mobilizing transposase RayT
MPRQIRVEYEGAIYHLLNRGDRREEIVRDDLDRRTFLETLGAACVKTDWQVHAYCLMSNHFHLVVETPRANLVSGMKWFLGTYTMRFNRRHRLGGHLFAGRYKSLLIDGSGSEYLRAVCDYVHLNPVRAGLTREDERMQAYAWSSYGAYLRPARRPAWLRCDRLLGEHGLEKEGRASRVEFARRMEARRLECAGKMEEQIRRGWLLGAEDFLARLLDRLEPRLAPQHRATERSETEEQKGQRLIEEGLSNLGWSRQELKLRRKSDADKVALACRLRRETAVSLKWIAEQLEMGTWTHVSNLLRRE